MRGLLREAVPRATTRALSPPLGHPPTSRPHPRTEVKAAAEHPSDVAARSYVPPRGHAAGRRGPLPPSPANDVSLPFPTPTLGQRRPSLGPQGSFYPSPPIPWPRIFPPLNSGFMVKMSTYAHKVYKTPKQRGFPSCRSNENQMAGTEK